METPSILIVDDEKIAVKNLEHIMKKEGYNVSSTLSGKNALIMLQEREFDIILTDLRMEKVDGMQVLKKAKELYPDTEVILITGYATVSSAIDAMKHGAFYYITKPFRLEEVRKVVKDALEKVKIKKENLQLKDQIDAYQGRVNIVTQNTEMKKILTTARQIAPSDCNVLISGESGTGKELFAKYVHFNSTRHDKPFLPVNCGAFTEELLTNELFGHEKGAFTGANSLKKGLIEMADQGTLFLDEITEMPPSMQVKLLRVIQEKELLRVGGNLPISVNVRFIAATNRDIEKAMDSGIFRRDLYYRINVITLNIPPLSRRKDDVPLLCYYFLKKFNHILKKQVGNISEDVFEILLNYDFPGNVMALEHIIERAVILCNSDKIELAHLPSDLRDIHIKTFRKIEGRIHTLEEQEINYIKWVMEEVGGNKTLASQLLGIDRVSLWRKLKKFGLEE